jgi:outer membrane lipoprotein-sorting protein
MVILRIAMGVLTFAIGLQAQSVDAILARMDQAAPAFRGMSADAEMKTYTAILSDTTTENGTLKMQRLKSGEVRAVIDFSGQQDARVIAFLGKIVRIYYPKLKAYQDYAVGKNTDVLNQFLLLGFGSSGRELAQSYQISLEGTEKVAGKDTTKLLLVPKDPKVKEHLTKIEMWVPNDAAYPIQQQFYEPSGNYRVVSYSNVKINPSMHGILELKMPGDVKKQGS